MPSGEPRPTIWNGHYYESMADAARALGISREAMRQLVEKGYQRDSDINHRQTVWWNGRKYKSISALARKKGVSKSTAYNWILRGYTCDDDLKPPGRPRNGVLRNGR